MVAALSLLNYTQNRVEPSLLRTRKAGFPFYFRGFNSCSVDLLLCFILNRVANSQFLSIRIFLWTILILSSITCFIALISQIWPSHIRLWFYSIICNQLISFLSSISDKVMSSYVHEVGSISPGLFSLYSSCSLFSSCQLFVHFVLCMHSPVSTRS